METPNPGAGKMHARKSWFISIEAGTRTIGCEPSTSADHAAYAMLKTACKTLSAK